MKIKRTRLFEQLRPRGFSYGPPTRAADAFTFLRPSLFNGLWESIIVDSQGKYGEAVYASVGASITKSVMYKVLGRVLLLDEIGENPERGWTIIESDAKALDWEQRLADLGPSKAQEWALDVGPKLLQDTEAARRAVDGYMSKLLPIRNLDESLERLRASATTEIVKDVDRLSVSPGAIAVFGTETAYELACYTLLKYSFEIENGVSFVGRKPADDLEMLQRIHILADRILRAAECNETSI